MKHYAKILDVLGFVIDPLQGFPRQHSPHSPAERTAEWIGRYVSVAGSDGRSGSPASSSRGSPSSSNRNSISSTNSGGCVVSRLREI